MKRKELTSFALIFLLAAGLRLGGITFDSLWLDESYQTFSESIAQTLPDLTGDSGTPLLFKFGPPQPVSHLLATFRSVDPLCPPLYAVVLNRWMTAFGTSDFAARSLSVVLSLLSLGIIYIGARAALNPGAAACAALLQAISPFDIYYAQEARMYTLEMVLSTISCLSLLWLYRRFLEPAPRDGAGDTPRKRPHSALATAAIASIYTISTWAMINTHYTALFVAAFQGLVSVFLCLRYRNPRLACVLVGAWLATALLWLPWFGLFRQSASIRTASFYVARQATWWWPIWAVMVRIPFNWMVFLSGKQVVAWAAPLYLTSLSFIAAAALASLRAIRCRDAAFMPRLSQLFFWSWALIPPLLVWLIDVVESHRVVEISRYLTATAPAVFILAGWGLSEALNAKRLMLVVLLLHAGLALGNNAYAHSVPQREPWRKMAALVEAQVRPDEPLLIAQYYNIVCLDRYLTRPQVQIGLSPSQGSEHMEQVLSGRKRFWLLTAQEGEAVAHMVPDRFKELKKFDLRHALHLRLFEESR